MSTANQRQRFRLLRQTYPRVVRLSVCLSHSCTLLKSLDGMRCHFPSNIVLDRGPRPPWKDIGDLKTFKWNKQICLFGEIFIVKYDQKWPELLRI